MSSNKKTPEAVGAANEGKSLDEGTNNKDTNTRVILIHRIVRYTETDCYTLCGIDFPRRNAKRARPGKTYFNEEQQQFHHQKMCPDCRSMEQLQEELEATFSSGAY